MLSHPNISTFAKRFYWTGWFLLGLSIAAIITFVLASQADRADAGEVISNCFLTLPMLGIFCHRLR